MNLVAVIGLALAAEDDEHARVVLADAIEELPWLAPFLEEDCSVADLVVLRLALDALEGGAALRTFERAIAESEWRLPDAFVLRFADLEDHARAVAAILLFGGWPDRWRLASRCANAELGT